MLEICSRISTYELYHEDLRTYLCDLRWVSTPSYSFSGFPFIRFPESHASHVLLIQPVVQKCRNISYANGCSPTHRASGLGRATALELAQHGGNISILDLNEENGAELVKQLGGESRAKFFQVDVTDSDSIEAAVKGTMSWVDSTKAPLGGIIPAAGVGIPGLVCENPQYSLTQRVASSAQSIIIQHLQRDHDADEIIRFLTGRTGPYQYSQLILSSTSTSVAPLISSANSSPISQNPRPSSRHLMTPSTV